MKTTQIATIAALCAVLISGCGTIKNLTSGNPDVPFGGVQRDIAYIETPRGNQSGIGVVPAMLVIILPVELTLSAFGDVVTLPLAIAMHQSDVYVPVDGHEKEDQAVLRRKAGDAVMSSPTP